MEDDLDIDPSKRRVPLQGRRAAGGLSGAGDAAFSAPPSKTTGWGETDNTGGKAPSSGSNAFDDDDNANDIPQIPDLEEMTEENFIQTTAAPPSVRVQHVPTLVELESELIKHAALLTLDSEIDLKLLASKLNSRDEVMEEDRMWDWDTIFTDVTSELHAEGVDGGGGDGDGDGAGVGGAATSATSPTHHTTNAAAAANPNKPFITAPLR